LLSFFGENKMPKCIYKYDGICCCSTSGHHNQKVKNIVCNGCLRQTPAPIVSNETKFKKAIEDALKLLPNVVGNDKAVDVLTKALKGCNL
jgi:hypothetical protein